MSKIRLDLMVLIATVGCDGAALVAPSSIPADLESMTVGVEGVSVAIADTRAGDGMVAVYWASGRPRYFGLVLDSPPPPPAVARTRLFLSDEGPEQGFRLVAERADSGLDTTFVGPLTNGVNYYFRAAVYDSTGTLFGVSPPAMTTPGPLIGPTVRVAAPQADEPLWLSNLSWSPDGRRLAVIKAAAPGERPDIYVFSLDDRRFRPVTLFSTSSASYRLGSVDWSPDGQSLAFGYSPSATFIQTDYRIWRVGVDGSGMRSLSSGRVDDHGVWVTPRELVFTRGTYGPPNVPEIYRLQLGPPARETAVTSGDTLKKYHLSYSPHTDQIVFSGGVSGRSLYLVSREGGGLSRMTDSWAPPYLGDIHPGWTDASSASSHARRLTGSGSRFWRSSGETPRRESQVRTGSCFSKWLVSVATRRIAPSNYPTFRVFRSSHPARNTSPPSAMDSMTIFSLRLLTI